jgi:hypothetical protein
MALGLIGCASLAQAASPAPATADPAALMRLAPHADPQVLRLASSALSCALNHGASAPARLAVIDYSRPSDQSRLWVFDLQRRSLMFEERVAHGRGSGEVTPVSFSNAPESHQSSLGLFRTGSTYMGRNGYSLKLQGLEPGINDRAEERAIVMHGADYVSDLFIRTAGRLGRSFGCPAVRRDIAKPLIDALKNDQYLFSYYPDARWLKTSRYVHCDGRDEPQTAALTARSAQGGARGVSQ